MSASTPTSSPARPEVTWTSGETRPALGLGTWRLGERRSSHDAEVQGLQRAMQAGWRVFDSAEMYGDGGAEAVLGEALDGALKGGLARDDLFVVTKALPQNACVDGLLRACAASLERLRLDQVDLYLLHWRGNVSLVETVRGFEQLQARGWIRRWGVSNFDLDDMHELHRVPGGKACAVNQVDYSLAQRGVEFDLLPWMRLQQMPLMAYCPLDQGALVDHPALRGLAQRHRSTPAKVALAWLLHQPGVMAIPKAGNPLHLRHNWSAQDLRLSAGDLAELDRSFPPPRSKQPLSVR
ncbi:MAG: aldo/keto reductase [Rubrivivax sp.]